MSIRQSIDIMNAEKKRLEEELGIIQRSIFLFQGKCEHNFEHYGRTTYQMFGHRRECYRCTTCDLEDWSIPVKYKMKIKTSVIGDENGKEKEEKRRTSN